MLSMISYPIVSEMTYNVSMGTLNPTIPYCPRAGKAYTLLIPKISRLFSIHHNFLNNLVNRSTHSGSDRSATNTQMPTLNK